MKVVLAAVARATANAMAAGWAKNRPKAPGAFRRDLAAGLARLAEHREIGEPYVTAEGRAVRRHLLRTVQCYLQYEVQANRVEVLMIWSARRGEGPPMGS